jgi:S-adenosylmethionine synthetase
MFTSESVTEGHPDKLCDQISDTFVDHFLKKDPYSRIIAECAVSTSIVFVAARFNSHATVDFPYVAREVIKQIGYNQIAFNAKTCSIVTSLKEIQREDYGYTDERTMTDEEIERVPVRNQVTVFGFACNQTPALMPMPIWLAHKLSRRLTSVRLQKVLTYLEPDGKTQVGVEFKDRRPHRIHSITVIASQTKQGDPDLRRLAREIR